MSRTLSCRTYVRHLCIDFEISPIWSRWQKRRTVFAILGIHLQKVILKRKPAPFEQQRVSVPIEEQEQKCLSVCAIRCRECVKRVLLFPRLERQTQATNDVRPSAHIMWHEQRTGVACETRVPGVFATFCGQKVERERLQIEYTTKEARLKTAEEYNAIYTRK